MIINVNGVQLYYEVMGSGSPLIMVHGNGENHTIFDTAAAMLSEHYTCYLIDSRGHGKSQSVDFFTYDDMAKDMAEFIRELELKDVTFFGFSDGGITGLLLACEYPDLVKTLIVSGANIQPRGVKDSIYYAFKLLYFFTRDPKIRLMLDQPNIPEEQLQKITARTLVLAGSKDMIKESETRIIAASVPKASLRILKGETHGSYIVHSDKIARLILAFRKHTCG